MTYARATTVDASHGGDSVKQAVLDCDTDLTGIFANLNTHEALTVTHGATGAIVGSTNTVTLTNKTLTTPVIATLYQDAGKTKLITFPAASDTLMGKATTDTLTNKTFDTAGTGNSFSINGTAVSAITGTGAAVLATSPTITTPTLSIPVIGDFTSANHDHTSVAQGGIISPSQAASNITITDSGNIITATNVETALQEIKTAVNLNTAKTTNATHTGDVTGSGALTIGAKKVTVAMLADGTDGQLITWDSSGAATTVATGTATHVLTSNGAGSAPTFQAPSLVETAWEDYSGTSTITGWAAGATKRINTQKIGRICFVSFYITGTSNATSASFTVPYTAADTVSYFGGCAIYAENNSAAITSSCRLQLNPNSVTTNVYSNMSTGTWTASNTKTIMGSFWYEVTE